MSEPVFRNFSDIVPKEIAPGFLAKAIHTDNNTINFVDVKAGSTIAIHQHIHHQSAFVLEGEFELMVNGETTLLTPGLYAIIPPNIPHGGTAITDCRILDIFSPIREDYR